MSHHLRSVLAPLALLANVMLAAGCGGRQGLLQPSVDSSGSILATIPGVDDSLRKAVDLKFRLLCSADRAKLKDAKALEMDDDKDQAKVEVRFKAKDVNTKDWCVLEVVAKDPSKLDPKLYRWTSKRPGLFFATSAAQVDDKRHLEVTMHQLFEDLTKPSFAVVVNSEFPAAGKLDGAKIESFQLTCAGVAQPATKFNVTAGGKVSINYDMVREKFVKPVPCSIEATIGTDVYTAEAKIEIVNTTSGYGPVKMNLKRADDADDVQISSTSGDACTWDDELQDCVKTETAADKPATMALTSNAQ